MCPLIFFKIFNFPPDIQMTNYPNCGIVNKIQYWGIFMREKHAISDHLPKVAYDGKISIGNKELSCAVLDDGTRILTNAAVFSAFDRPRKGKTNEENRLRNTPAFLTANNLLPYIEREFAEDDFSVKYIYSGRELIGYKADILSRICDIFLFTIGCQRVYWKNLKGLIRY